MICRETTLGAVEIIAGKARRRSGGRTDYTLRIRVNAETQPVAVALIEAKKDTLPPGHGLDQAKGYLRASQHNVQFVFSSNGHLFVEFDRSTGMTSAPRPISEFPDPGRPSRPLRTHHGLLARRPSPSRCSCATRAARAAPLLPGRRHPRRLRESRPLCPENRPPRALLSLATGTGKTFIAVHLLKRIADAGQLKRALFLCDRDELRTQGLKAMQGVFGADAAEVYEEAGGRNHAKNARVHVATYQTLGIDRDDGDASFLLRHYPENYFCHIVIDECHRSAWGKWSIVLTRNPNAVQIGLTATPRQLECGENTKEAKADARSPPTTSPTSASRSTSTAWRRRWRTATSPPAKSSSLRSTSTRPASPPPRSSAATRGTPTPASRSPRPKSPRLREDRLRDQPAAAGSRQRDVPRPVHAAPLQRSERGPQQKTIIFCARDRHADDVATAMNNLYAQWCKQKGVARKDPYAFKCTAASTATTPCPTSAARPRRTSSPRPWTC